MQGELRAQHRLCSHMGADDKRERMQHLQLFRPVVDLLEKDILWIKSALGDTHHQAVNKPAAPQYKR